ncbi:MAG: Uma2 family endonuclease [Longimicrobiales bacterium]
MNGGSGDTRAYGHDRQGPLTVEEFARLPEEDAYRIELVRGWLVREPQPGARHGRLSARLFQALNDYARATGAGEVLIELGFRLSADPATVRGPDVAFLAAARVPREMPVGFWEGAPDLAVEVVSPSNRRPDIDAKVRDYLDSGAHAVWVVDPATRTVEIHQPGEAARILSAADTLKQPRLLPGFRLPLSDLFE